MDFFEALERRRSIRAFQNRPVASETLKRLIAKAGHSPSAGNTQPWELVVAQGATLETIKAESERLFLAGVTANADLPNIFNAGKVTDSWPELLAKRYQDCGRLVLGSLAIERGDKEGRMKFYRDMHRFFDAPVVLFVGFDRKLPEGYAMYDLGLFSQSLCLAAQAEELGTCIMAVGGFYPDMLRTHANIPPHLKIAVGIALGHPDMTQPINNFERQYAPLNEWVHGL